jgi:hypothetical protein
MKRSKVLLGNVIITKVQGGEMKHEVIKVGGLAIEHYIPEENKD